MGVGVRVGVSVGNGVSMHALFPAKQGVGNGHVTVGVGVRIGVGVRVAVRVGVSVIVTVGVTVGVPAVDVGVGVGDAWGVGHTPLHAPSGHVEIQSEAIVHTGPEHTLPNTHVSPGGQSAVMVQ